MKSTEERQRFRSLPARILLVEGNPGDASLVISALSEPSGLFAVKWVSSLEAGIDALSGEHCECLLVDLDLPDAGGLDVMDSLRRIAGDTALVVLTGRGEEEMGLRAIHHGADDYFSGATFGPGPVGQRTTLASPLEPPALCRQSAITIAPDVGAREGCVDCLSDDQRFAAE